MNLEQYVQRDESKNTHFLGFWTHLSELMS